MERKKKWRAETIWMEYSVAAYFGWRQNEIVPNISWGLGLHECDLLVMTKAGYLYEVEIKVSKADLIKDHDKDHGHNDNRIRCLWFAIPEYLEPEIGHVPERAGILSVRPVEGWIRGGVRVLRKPVVAKSAKPVTPEIAFKICRLGTMRIWTLKAREIEHRRTLRETLQELNWVRTLVPDNDRT